MVCCTTLWWDGAGKGRGWKMAAIIYCWQQQQHVRGRTAQLLDISSGATCVADLDSGALALTKEVPGNSRGVCVCVCVCVCVLVCFETMLRIRMNMLFLVGNCYNEWKQNLIIRIVLQFCFLIALFLVMGQDIIGVIITIFICIIS